VGLYIETKVLPRRGKIAKVKELKIIITKASLFVHATSSMQRFVFPRLSNEGLSSGLTKSNSFKLTDTEVSKLVNIPWQYIM